jgi:hypothetical protein
MHNQYLVCDNPTPFGTLQEALKYSGFLARGTPRIPNCSINSTTKTASVDDTAVSLDTFVDMVKWTIDEAKTMMDEKILFGHREAICGVQTGYFSQGSVIFDKMHSNDVGYSYLSDPRNSCFVNHEQTLINFIRKHKDLSRQFIQHVSTESRKVVWNISRIREWLSQVDRFLLLLAAGHYWASGAPYRLPELTGLRVVNGSSETRNVHMMEGCLTISQSYRKGLYISGIPNRVVRAPAYELQCLTEAFWCLVQPLMVLFRQKCEQDISNNNRILLFTQKGEAMRPEQLSKELMTMSRKCSMGCPKMAPMDDRH